MTVFTRLARIILYITVFMTAAGLGTYFTIHLLIHSGERVIVPDLVGKEVVYALEVLSDLGLNTKVKGTEFSPVVPKHHVIDQHPDPGTEIKRGRDVRLVISKGMRTVVFPNVVGMDHSMAGIIIDENDLHQRKLTYTYSPDQPQGRILSQYPGAGTKSVRGDGIDLLISAGPPPRWLRMTDLGGMGLDEAIEIIEKHQLAVGTITQADSATAPVDTVTHQDPAPGAPVLPGTAVELTINRPNPGGRTDVQSRTATLFRYRVPQGFLRQQIRVRINRPDVAVDIYDDFVKPGEEIWLVVLRDVPTTLFLYLDDDLIMTKHYD